jgi:hypothetical protein
LGRSGKCGPASIGKGIEFRIRASLHLHAITAITVLRRGNRMRRAFGQPPQAIRRITQSEERLLG